MKFLSILLCFTLIPFNVSLIAATGAEHPRIYISNEAKAEFLQSVEQVAWKENIINNKKKNLEKYLKLCANDPNWLVSRLQMNWKTKHSKVFLKGGKFSHSEGNAPSPTVRFSGSRDWATDYRSLPLEEIEPYLDDERGLFLRNKSTGEKEWVHPSKTGHLIEKTNERIMNLVADAAFLYWLTGDEKYAAFAAPVYDTYMKGMYHREAPLDLDNTNQQRLSGLATFEVIHEGILIPLATTYDFLFHYFNKNNYDLNLSVAVFQKWADQIIKNGVPNNNWNFFQARFLTYIALVLDENSNYQNGKGQEYYLQQTFDRTSERQIALKESIMEYDQENGIWPESPSYSIHVTTTLLRILTLLDQVTNNNEFKNYPIVEKASFAAFQYLFPSGRTVGFGDSGHGSIPSENFELLISNYRKYNDEEKELLLSGMLKSSLKERKTGKGLFELFFYVDHLKETPALSFEQLLAKQTTPSFYAPNVSMFIQRMGVNENAIMVSTVGSLGNHAHANGIAMELYANNYVLGPDMGKGPSYWHDDHLDYYSQFPAHNTVVVDGISTYQAMRSYHPFSLDNHFPKKEQSSPIFNQISFSKVSFVEPKTLSDQQRLTAIINSELGNGYVLDIFRSKKQDSGPQTHDYFYHNLGQSLTFLDEQDAPLILKSTDELGTNHGDMKAYDYLSNKQKLSYNKSLKAIFKLKSEGQEDNLMKIWIKGGTNQHFFSAMAPNSRAINSGTAPVEVLGQSIPTLVIRKEQEAWRDPFVCIFNPYFEGKNPIISSVDFNKLGSNNHAQIIQVKHSDEITEDQIIATTSVNDIAEKDQFYLKGLLAIQRTSGDQLKYIFASGFTRYINGDWSIISSDEAASVSIERKSNLLLVQNDRPVVVSIPIGLNPKYIEYYQEGELNRKRVGVINRINPTQVNFKLEKPYQKAVIVLGEQKK
ncbi:MAG: heparinase II/III family protein [Saprospiraceae bacterium]